MPSSGYFLLQLKSKQGKIQLNIILWLLIINNNYILLAKLHQNTWGLFFSINPCPVNKNQLQG
jgi:hypothetical protein